VKFKGIPASPGVGVGPIFRLEREELAVRDTPVAPEDVEREVARFHAALDASRADLVSIRDRIARGFRRQVYGALSDPVFRLP